MYSDDTGRELAAALRESAAASLKLATAITTAAAQLRPTANMSAAELQDLANQQRLREPAVLDPNTHEGEVEQNIRTMLAMRYGGE